MNAKTIELLHDHSGNLAKLVETIPSEQQFLSQQTFLVCCVIVHDYAFSGSYAIPKNV